jgi:rubrerythrin
MDAHLCSLVDTAIAREEDAYRFYTELGERVSDPAAREAIRWVAGEEVRHKEFLVRYRAGEFGAAALRLSEVVATRIAEHMAEPERAPQMSSAEVFLTAAHRELRSHRFYTELAGQHAAGEAREILLKMANEELRHKEKMEYLYVNTAFPQTSGG